MNRFKTIFFLKEETGTLPLRKENLPVCQWHDTGQLLRMDRSKVISTVILKVAHAQHSEMHTAMWLRESFELR